MTHNCGPKFEYYTAHLDLGKGSANDKCLGKYKMNIAYNTVLELAEIVSAKIYQLYKPKKFKFYLFNRNTKAAYHYMVDFQSHSFLEYGDYRIGHDKDRNGCDTYHPRVILPVMTHTTYPEVKVPTMPYWAGDKIPGLFRDDVFNYIHGKWYGN
jgi:hypothetical protein